MVMTPFSECIHRQAAVAGLVLTPVQQETLAALAAVAVLVQAALLVILVVRLVQAIRPLYRHRKVKLAD
jgi:hypothetical protein